MKWIIEVNGKKFILSIWVRWMFGVGSVQIGEGKRKKGLK